MGLDFGGSAVIAVILVFGGRVDWVLGALRVVLGSRCGRIDINNWDNYSGRTVHFGAFQIGRINDKNRADFIGKI